MKIKNIADKLKLCKDVLEKALNAPDVLIANQNGQWSLKKANIDISNPETQNRAKKLKEKFFGNKNPKDETNNKITKIKQKFKDEANDPSRDPQKVNMKFAAQTMKKEEKPAKPNTLDYTKINQIKTKPAEHTLNYKEINNPKQNRQAVPTPAMIPKDIPKKKRTNLTTEKESNSYTDEFGDEYERIG